MRTSKVLVVGLVCGVLAVSGAKAQVQQGLEYSITPFLWAMSLDGTIGLGQVSGSVDASFSDLLDSADLVVPIHFEAKGPVWTLIAEINFAALSQDVVDQGSVTGGLDIDMLVAELLSGYEFAKFTQLIFGVRYVSLDSVLSFKGPGLPMAPGVPTKFDAGQDWVDPVVGIRYGGPIGRRWRFSIRGDAAGFGLGSQLTWNVRTNFGVEVSDVTTLLAGWHVMDMDYDSNNFLYDMTYSGPEFAVSFKF